MSRELLSSFDETRQYVCRHRMELEKIFIALKIHNNTDFNHRMTAGKIADKPAVLKVSSFGDGAMTAIGIQRPTSDGDYRHEADAPTIAKLES